METKDLSELQEIAADTRLTVAERSAAQAEINFRLLFLQKGNASNPDPSHPWPPRP